MAQSSQGRVPKLTFSPCSSPLSAFGSRTFITAESMMEVLPPIDGGLGFHKPAAVAGFSRPIPPGRAVPVLLWRRAGTADLRVGFPWGLHRLTAFLPTRPNPELWGLPDAHFSLGDDCDGGHFSDLKVVINLTFCGDWAGNFWSASRCSIKGTSCDAYVRGHPDAFEEAYWSIKHVQVYKRSPES